MPIQSGARLGSYEIVAPIGAGGMGEVYRAHDAKLGRDVAIKVLPAAYATHADRLERFEQEARAAGMLNHPNLLSVYELGVHDGSPYIVTELLEGETLRARMQTDDGAAVAIAPRKAIEYATQLATGLAAAHAKGIVHRDLKPENIFITADNRVKILDFGLAKLTAAPEDEDSGQYTMKRNTAPGTVLGTAGYMSPEQVRGQSVDHRSDIFSLGAILYEMLSGRRAFRGDSSVETMNAILKEEPPELTSVTSAVPPALQRVVDHCLEKNADARFQSARDLAFDLQSISSLSESGVSIAARTPTSAAKWIGVAIAVAVVAIAAAWTAMHSGKAGQPQLHQLTFRRGTVRAARFAPDGQSIVYSAAWDGGSLRLFQTRTNAFDSVPLQLPGADLLAMSPAGDIAIAINRQLTPWAGYGTLAQASMLAAAPRELLEDVSAAEWSADGKQLIVVHRVGNQDQLEWPLGKTILRTAGYFDHMRIAPDGKTLAFLNHPLFGDNRGDVMTTDAAGTTHTLVKDWASIEGLAWSPDGKEIWFTGDRDGTVGDFEMYGVDESGHLRSVWQVPTNVSVLDIARDGRVLVTSGGLTGSIYARGAADAGERDLAWLAWTAPAAISADGKLLLMVSYGAGAGRYYSTSVRPTDGSPGTRLAEGEALDLSADKKWALSLKDTSPPQLVATPTGAGQSRAINAGGLNVRDARFLPDNRILVATTLNADRVGFAIADLSGGFSRLSATAAAPSSRAQPIIVSTDGTWVATKTSGAAELTALPAGPTRPLAGVDADDKLVCAPDARSLYVARVESGVIKIDRLDVSTGQRQHVLDVPIPDVAGAIFDKPQLFLSADAKTYVTGVTRWLTDLYVVDGLR